MDEALLCALSESTYAETAISRASYTDPKGAADVEHRDDKLLWYQALQREYDKLMKFGTFEEATLDDVKRAQRENPNTRVCPSLAVYDSKLTPVKPPAPGGGAIPASGSTPWDC